MNFKKYWNDPVWSKVIAAGIISILSTIFIGIYTLSQKLISNISFKSSFIILKEFFLQEFTISLIWLFLIIAFLLAFFLKPFWNFYLALIEKINLPNKTNEKLSDKLPIAYNIPTAMFSERMSSAFPGIRDITWFNEPSIARKRLKILLRTPLVFQTPNRSGIVNPFWWFRETSSMFIENFEVLNRNKILMNRSEIEIKRIAAYHGDSYYKDFVYVEAKGVKPSRVCKYSNENIENCKKSMGYCSEEIGLMPYLYFWKRSINRDEYDDGATVVGKNVEEARGAKLRVRYLTDYNFIIAAHNSPYNSRKFEAESKKFFDGILNGTVEPDDFLNFLKGFHKNEE